MDIEYLVQFYQERNNCNYYSAIAQAEVFLEAKYGKQREIKDAIAKLRHNDNKHCPACEIEMELFDERTLWCPNCGRLANNCNDDNDDFSEGKAVFDNEKHFIDWINHILGKESIITKWNKSAEFTKHVKDIRDYAQKNNIHQLTPEDLRLILKNLKLTKYYKHTSYYFKELTNVEPPNIPETYIHRAVCLFRQFVKARQQIKGLKKNIPSYPFLIYKIFDKVLPDDIENRRIFHFIHLPSEKTLEKRSKEWEIIWQHIDKSDTQ